MRLSLFVLLAAILAILTGLLFRRVRRGGTPILPHIEGFQQVSGTRPVRYIRIEGGRDSLQLSQVVVININNENVALNGKVEASEPIVINNRIGLPKNAVDGILQVRDWPSIYHSNSTTGAYYEIDLEDDEYISSITIYNRGESCCSARLGSGYKVNCLNSMRGILASYTLTSELVQTFDNLIRTNDTATTVSEFSRMVDTLSTSVGEDGQLTQDGYDLLSTINTVAQPSESDLFQMSFSKYISIYALAKYMENTVLARNALLKEYDLLYTQMTATVYNQTTLGKWTQNPKVESCATLDTLKGDFERALVSLRTTVQDVSGAEVASEKMRDENMGFQMKHLTKCSSTPMSSACVDLASKEPILFPMLAEFEQVNSSLLEKEIDIQENIAVLNDTYILLQCQNAVPIVYNSDINTGSIDIEALRAKLETLSPYYLAPATLAYITSNLITPEEVDDTLMLTKDYFIHMNKTIGSIRGVTGVL